MAIKTLFKKLFLALLKSIYYFFILVMVYHVLVFLLGLIPVNKDFKNTAEGIPVFIGTNGVHTNILMPVKNKLHDWRKVVSLQHFPEVDSSFNYISLGWGDKGFYINTPTWSDLTIGTAFKALFLPSETAMHVVYLQDAPITSDRYVQLFISDEQYQTLINYIMPYFEKKEDGEVILIEEASYGYNDNFYEAHDTYHFLNTSNTWTNRALKKTGIRSAFWSPLDKPIMNQLRKIK